MQTFRADLRLAFRMLAKKPGFTVVAVLTLALGIAVNATMFSLVSAFLLRRPPVHDPDRIVVVSSVNPNPVFTRMRALFLLRTILPGVKPVTCSPTPLQLMNIVRLI
jgi:hypothetical protein